MNNKPKLILIIIIIFISISLAIYGYLYYQRNRNLPPKSTGAIPETLSLDEQNYLKTFAKLRDSCPIIINQFTIKFDYATNKFNIYVSEPYENNKQFFLNWLPENGYDIIPIDKFNYKIIGND